ncbi:hypothetical protein SAMN05421749_10979 [Acinetobacter marinus]|uniref:LA2681-like HEPN domain-containing protein n=1 Tax=Acinetobacter marinus TaxID=281375 RepID=A0A1G6NEZ9_9GAMM|nr:LA2681 family HEPN domain-containing protein [Acinetobacter marinus]SDC65886.1 hypothetical protein SAMN05421749_10979 [Acinetobacter marinus]
MILLNIEDELSIISQQIDNGEFEKAFDAIKTAFSRVKRLLKNKQYFDHLFAISGLFIDVGHMGRNSESTLKGLKILEDNRQNFERYKGHYFYYFYANALSYTQKNEDLLDYVNFQNVENLNYAKRMYWKAIKSVQKQHNTVPDEYLVNLANSLKSQYRITEALQYYDQVNQKNRDLPQAWTNRSEALIILNKITSSLSIVMLKEIRVGYLFASKSNNVPKIWHPFYKSRSDSISKHINELSNEIDETDHEDALLTQNEYNDLSSYRKWCLDRHLSLTEHGLYCKCIESGTDNLTIMENVIGDQTIASMELVLNRLKSEFGFSRHLYYEYLNSSDWTKNDIEQSFSELFNDEVLGLNIERVRTAFRICFGILDKIGVAIFDLLKLKREKNEMIYFHSFWKKTPERFNLFQNIQNYGLIALYSIANDLNSTKTDQGELSFYKKWRNLLEHDFMIIHTNKSPEDLYGSYKGFTKQITFVNENDFIESLTHVLQLTRSAIFSFVFAVREHAKQNSPDKGQIIGTLEVHKKQGYF